jgi:hypothetical protein
MFSTKSKNIIPNGNPTAAVSSQQLPPTPAIATSVSPKFGGYFSSDSLTKIFKTPSNFVQSLNSHISFGSTTPTACPPTPVPKQTAPPSRPQADLDKSSPPQQSSYSNNKPDENVNYKTYHNVEQKKSIENRNNNNDCIKIEKNSNNRINSATLPPTTTTPAPATSNHTKVNCNSTTRHDKASQPTTKSNLSNNDGKQPPTATVEESGGGKQQQKTTKADQKNPQQQQQHNLIRKDNKNDESNDDKIEQCHVENKKKINTTKSDKSVDCHNDNINGQKQNNTGLAKVIVNRLVFYLFCIDIPRSFFQKLRETMDKVVKIVKIGCEEASGICLVFAFSSQYLPLFGYQIRPELKSCLQNWKL